MKYKVLNRKRALLFMSFALVLCGCASDPLAVKTVTRFHGHCYKAQLGDEDLTSACIDELTKIDFVSGISSFTFLLTGDRTVMFISGNAQNTGRPAAGQHVLYSVSVQTGANLHDYKMPVVICSTTTEVPVPSKIDCIGQAEGKPVYFEFRTEGQAQVQNGP